MPGQGPGGPTAESREDGGPGGWQSSPLGVTQPTPVSFTLAPSPAMEKLLDEILGLFLHYRVRVGRVRAGLPPAVLPTCLLAQ